MRNEKEARLWARLKEIWEPILLEVLVDPDQLPTLWEKVGEKDHLQFVEYLLRYAQRLGGEERDILRKAAAPYLPEILPLLRHGQMGVRARAVQALGTLGLPKFTAPVRAAIDDSSPFVAAIAARLLAQELGAEMALDLFRNLDRFRSFRIWYLVDMVVGLGPGAVPAIRSTLADAAMPARTRAVAAHALSVLRDLGSADLAANLTATESDPELLASLLRLLAQVGTPDHSPAVRARLDSEEFFVRAAATRTLSELGGKEDLPLLVEKLSDPSSWVKVAAARGVYRLGGRAALAVLNRPNDPAGPVFRQVLAEEGQ
jgi:HEAT repeat protein